jgi:NTE family protein
MVEKILKAGNIQIGITGYQGRGRMEIALALGGGGVKGNAHIGVLRVLERSGVRIHALAGTSAGGLWGALFAAGYHPDEIEQFFKGIDPSTIYNRRPGEGPSWLGLAGIYELLQEKLGDITFEDLAIPFAVTAVDIDRAEQVILRQGKVLDAVLATIAVPGVFSPVLREGRTLIDGGVLDPVPVVVARSLAPELPVVAVVLSPPLTEWGGPVRPRLLNSLPFIANYIAKMRIAQATNIFLRSIDIGGAMLTELRLKLDKPDVIIRPAVPQIGLLDQVDIGEVARLGEHAAEAALPEIRKTVSWRGWLSRKISRTIERGLFNDDRRLEQREP